jgi:hypothetical protein
VDVQIHVYVIPKKHALNVLTLIFIYIKSLINAVPVIMMVFFKINIPKTVYSVTLIVKDVPENLTINAHNVQIQNILSNNIQKNAIFVKLIKVFLSKNTNVLNVTQIA